MTTTPEKQVTFGFRPATAEEIAVTTPEAEGIEETHNTREVEDMVTHLLMATNAYGYFSEKGITSLRQELSEYLHHQLQKAREEERERIGNHIQEYGHAQYNELTHEIIGWTLYGDLSQLAPTKTDKTIKNE